jgi:hypothetical protein
MPNPPNLESQEIPTSVYACQRTPAVHDKAGGRGDPGGVVQLVELSTPSQAADRVLVAIDQLRHQLASRTDVDLDVLGLLVHVETVARGVSVGDSVHDSMQMTLAVGDLRRALGPLGIALPEV